MKHRSKFVGHCNEIVRQSKIKGPLISMTEYLSNAKLPSNTVWIGGIHRKNNSIYEYD